MRSPARPYLFLLAGLVLVGLLYLVFSGLGSYDQRIIVTIGISMILAVSLNLVNGFTGQFSLGHAGFMSVGAYASAAFTTIILPSLYPGDGGLMQDAAFLLALLFGGIAAALAGLLVGVPSLRLKGDYLAIVTLGFGEIIRVILQNIQPLGGALGLANIPRITSFLWVFVILTIVVFVIEQIIRTTYGKGFLAVRDDEIAAEAMGVNTTRYKVVAFVVGAFFAGIAGGLYAHYNSLVKPDDFGFLKSVEIVVMVILGESAIYIFIYLLAIIRSGALVGMLISRKPFSYFVQRTVDLPLLRKLIGLGSTYGVIAAAAVLTWLPEGLREFELFGVRFSDFRMSIYALVLIGLMLLRGQGVFDSIAASAASRPKDRK